MFNSLFPEILFNILKYLDVVTLLKFSRTCKLYQPIFSPHYDYLWKIFTFDLINPTYKYSTIQEYNVENNTQFENWYELYMYVYIYPLNTDSLIYECKEGHLDIVKYLLEHIVEDTEKNQNDAFIKACEHGHLSIVQMLTHKGIKIHQKTEQAFIKAIRQGHLHIIDYLILHGANIHMHNNSPLIITCIRGNLDVLRYLIDKGCDVNVRNSEALISACEEGHVHIVRYLIECGANIHADNDRALVNAFIYKRFGIVKYLIAQCDDIKVYLKSACEHKNIELVKYLLSLIHSDIKIKI